MFHISLKNTTPIPIRWKKYEKQRNKETEKNYSEGSYRNAAKGGYFSFSL